LNQVINFSVRAVRAAARSFARARPQTVGLHDWPAFDREISTREF
jgi:hypothetical protein